MTNDLDLRERQELCDLMLRVGPDAPTLCGEWTTADLAAHLSIRERDPRSAPGILLDGTFAKFLEKLMSKERSRGFENVVERVRHPPKGPLSIPALRSAMSLVEYTVHHEDVRRPAGLGPRTDNDDLQIAIWAKACQLSGLIVRKAKIAPVSLELRATGVTVDKPVHHAGKGDRTVAVSGLPIEVLLFIYGRQAVADVQVEGDPVDVETARTASFGI